MNRFILIIIFILTLQACKQKTENPAKEEESVQTELTSAESIALRHGIDNWENVKELRFTFNVARGESGYNRSYIWETQTDDVTYISEGDTLQYNRNASLDSLSLQADMRFVNDSFWLLAPYKLIWDEETLISDAERALAPISGDSLNKVTLVYSAIAGGYTPGDAYDFFFTDDFLIKEWTYRRENSEQPSLSTQWSEIKDLGGLELATSHTDSIGSFKLFFTNLSVK